MPHATFCPPPYWTEMTRLRLRFSSKQHQFYGTCLMKYGICMQCVHILICEAPSSLELATADPTSKRTKPLL